MDSFIERLLLAGKRKLKNPSQKKLEISSRKHAKVSLPKCNMTNLIISVVNLFLIKII